jgi:hypothetical protein
MQCTLNTFPIKQEDSYWYLSLSLLMTYQLEDMLPAVVLESHLDGYQNVWLMLSMVCDGDQRSLDEGKSEAHQMRGNFRPHGLGFFRKQTYTE